MAPEDVRDLYWETLRQFDWHDSSANRPYQAQNQLKAWEAVLSAIRKDYEQETERLRQRVRDLELCIATTMTHASQRCAA